MFIGKYYVTFYFLSMVMILVMFMLSLYLCIKIYRNHKDRIRYSFFSIFTLVTLIFLVISSVLTVYSSKLDTNQYELNKIDIDQFNAEVTIMFIFLSLAVTYFLRYYFKDVDIK